MNIMEEVLHDICTHYNSNNRCIAGTECMYFYEGNTCAIGRYLKEPEKFKDIACGAYGLITGNGTEILKDKYRDISIDFWENVQDLHDFCGNWTETGLSDQGESIALDICKDFKLDPSVVLLNV